MEKTRWFYTYKSTFKGLLFILALIMIIAQVWFTQMIVSELREDQRQFVQMSAYMYSLVASAEGSSNLDLLLDHVITKISVPVILTDLEGNPVAHKIKEFEGESLPFSSATEKKLRDMAALMDRENSPIPVEYESMALNYIHYGDSEMIRLLNWLPAIEVSIVGLFILLGFVGFNNIRRSEQRFIWVGMAKETAHQLGTPISSLIGWLELLKQRTSREKSLEIVHEMAGDLNRLTRVAQRFSQIGSNSDLSEHDIVPFLHETVEYFRRRLPQSGKSVSITEHYPENVICRVNKDLFEWAVENLIKNALDAIETETGEISITVGKQNRSDLYSIDITDTGKGITLKEKKDIFKPGFSTKKRGWGLGLSLAKRIIEDYHGGRLFLKSTEPNGGTTMCILLKVGSAQSRPAGTGDV